MLAPLARCRIVADMHESKIHHSMEPLALSVEAGMKISSLGRSCFYDHLDINGGQIKTSLIRKRGSRRGRRLVIYASLREFIESGIDPTQKAEVAAIETQPAD